MSINSDSIRFYLRIANFYDICLWLFGYKLAVHYFIGLVPFERKAVLNVLDAGCGTGLYTFAFLKRFPHARIVAFDLNTNMIKVMENIVQRKGLNNHVSIFIGDVTKPLPLQHEQFDLIMTGGVLEYVDPEAAVKNFAIYLKRGGYFLNSPVKDNLFGRMVAKLYRFKPHSRTMNMSAFTNNGFIFKKIRGFPIIKEAHLFQMVGNL